MAEGTLAMSPAHLFFGGPMSLPSVPYVKRDFGLTADTLSSEDARRVLVEAMRRDLPLAVGFLQSKARAAREKDADGNWIEDPNSLVGKQLIRIHASDPLRQLASEYFCGGMQLSFVNCCKGKVGEPPADLFVLQVATQDGTIASADC